MNDHSNDQDKSKSQLIEELTLLRQHSEQQIQALQDNQTLVMDILNELPVGVAVLRGEEFEYTHANAFIAQFNGQPSVAHIGKTITEVVHPAAVDNIIVNLKKVRDTGIGIPQRELQVPLPNGEIKDLLDFHYPLKAHDSVLAVIVDITQQKKLEKRLKQAQKMESIGVLTGGIAHQFNNLLAPILGFTDILMDSKEQGDGDLKCLEQIQRAATKAQSLVQQMLTCCDSSMTQTQLVELTTLVADTLRLNKNNLPDNIVVHSKVTADLPKIPGMVNEIHQVMLNLYDNASQAMPQGGTLSISLKKACALTFDNEANSVPQDYVQLSVQDSGIGMTSSTVDCIFDPFFTTQDVGKGTGLGLSVVQGIVARHKGHIEVDSTKDQGSTFHVFFPMSVV